MILQAPTDLRAGTSFEAASRSAIRRSAYPSDQGSAFSAHADGRSTLLRIGCRRNDGAFR